jgi:Squalene-hopene cyclase C-terminal domain/Ankyrin repeat/Prenyltransferase and squalene oxidase repeat
LGRTPLMYAAASDILPVEEVKLLLDRGANVNAKDTRKMSGDSGRTALDIAKLHGDTPIVAMLLKADATGSAPALPVSKPKRANTIRTAIESSLPLIQQADANFMPKALCASCHNNSFAAMAVGAARRNGIAVDEKISAQQVEANLFGLKQLREILHQGIMGATGEYFGPTVVSDMLLGLAAENHKSDLNTDAVVMFLKDRQSPDGHWPYVAGDQRPPICSEYIAQTVMAMRAIQLYAPKLERASYDRAIQLAAAWIAKSQPKVNEDRVAKLEGLAWAGKDGAGKDKAAIRKAIDDLVSTQHPDGGWSDIDTTPSAAFATGRSLVALHNAGLPGNDPVYRRGEKFLLETQQEDGSWFVKSRAMTLQPYFDSGFPHGFDQWISAAGTSWATLALSLSAPPRSGASAADER